MAESVIPLCVVLGETPKVSKINSENQPSISRASRSPGKALAELALGEPRKDR